MSVPVTINGCSDLQSPEKRQEISQWCQKNPLDDYIYSFPCPDFDFSPDRPNSRRNAVSPNDWVVAGSAALFKFVRNFMFGVEHLLSKSLSEPNDTDIFLLGSSGPHRCPIGKVDIVHAPEKTVEELLLNFDLPCCRVATNSHFDYWISIHCLNAIFTGKYYLPSYCNNVDNFTNKLRQHRDQGTILPSAESTLFTRLQERIRKYDTRGFSVVWTDTDKILDWVKQRFHYAEWVNM